MTAKATTGLGHTLLASDAASYTPAGVPIDADSLTINAVDRLVWDMDISAFASGLAGLTCNGKFLADSPILNYLVDGDMEAAGTSAWTAIAVGTPPTLTKETGNPHSGTQSIRITQAVGASNSYIQQQLYVGVFRISGWARGDGSKAPRVVRGTVLWTGTSSTSWQYFDVTVAISTPGDIAFQLNGAGDGNWVEFDDLVMTRISAVHQPNSELVLNGTFADTLHWTQGTGWSIANGKATHTAPQTLWTSLTYTNTSVFTLGKEYRVFLKIVDRTAGSVRVRIGSSGLGAWYDRNGTFEFTKVCSGNTSLSIEADENFIGAIDSISVVETGNLLLNADFSAWTTDGSDDPLNWTVFEGSPNAVRQDVGGLRFVTPTGTANIKQTILTSGYAYRVMAKVISISGSLVTGTSTFAAGTITTVGTHEIIFIANNTTFQFSANAGTDAVIEYVTVERLNTVVVNGNFDTDTDWTKDAGWTIAAGVAHCDGSQVTSSNLYQAGVVRSNKKYRVQFTVSNYVAGFVRPIVGGNGNGTQRSANGTYTEDIIENGATLNFYIQADVNFIGDIDDVIVYELTEYYLKSSASFQGPGYFQLGTEKNPYPNSCLFEHKYGGSTSAFGASINLGIYPRLRDPILTTLSAGASLGATVLSVADDVTAEWQVGDHVYIADAAKVTTSEFNVITNVTSTMITVANPLAASKVVGAFIYNLNTNFISTGSGSGYFSNSIASGSVFGGSFRSYTYGILNLFALSTDPTQRVTIKNATYDNCSQSSGGAQGVTYENCILTATFNNSRHCILRNCHILAVFNSSQSVVDSCFIRSSVISPTISGSYNDFRNCIIEHHNSLVATTYNAVPQYMINCYINNVAIAFHRGDDSKLKNVVFSNVDTEFLGSPIAPEHYCLESFDHDGIPGDYRAKTQGALVMNTNAPGAWWTRANCYQIALASASYIGFFQRSYTLDPGETLTLVTYVAKDSSMAYLPRVWLFETGDDPLLGGTILDEQIMTDSINTQEALISKYTNTGPAPMQITARYLGKSAAGNVYVDSSRAQPYRKFHELTVDYEVLELESGIGTT